MNDGEKKARELPVVARRYERQTARCTYRRASVTSAEGEPLVRLSDAQAAICALTPPEGYEQALQDAARYWYIREIASGEPTAFGRIEDAAFAAHYGDPAQFDLNIDDQMVAVREVGRG